VLSARDHGENRIAVRCLSSPTVNVRSGTLQMLVVALVQPYGNAVFVGLPAYLAVSSRRGIQRHG